jgi:hypothetical protein
MRANGKSKSHYAIRRDVELNARDARSTPATVRKD